MLAPVSEGVRGAMSDAGARPGRAQLWLVGGFHLAAEGGATVDVPSRRGRALIAYLHLAPGQAAQRERLGGVLWSDRSEAQARASLRQCLFELKAALSPADLDLLDVGRERVALRADAVTSDVAELKRLLAADETEAAAALPGLIVGGQLLEGLELRGLFQDWLDQARAQFEDELASGVQDLLHRLEAQRRWREAHRVAEAFLRRDPLHEGVVAAAIRAEAALGNPAAAHRRFQSLKSALADGFGVAPGAAVSEAIAAVSKGPEVGATDAGSAGPVLAVLAFDNVSGNPEMDYFSDGVSDEILQTASRTLDLKVIARSSSFQFRGAAKAARHVGAQLGATHVLDGSVRRSGERVRISAQLIDCRTETTLWSDRFDRELSDAFALQDEIAQAVSTALKVAFAPGRPAEPVDALAYELYLRARNLEVAQKSAAARIALLEEAVARAPRFATAWAALCQARVAQARSGPRPKPFAELKAGVIEAAETALALDPSSGVAYASLSRLQPWGAYGERERLLRKAVEVAPEDSAALALMGAFCNHVGRVEQALGYLRRAYELDPLYPLTADIYGAVLGSADHPDGPAMYESWRRRWPEHLTFSLGPMNLAMFQEDWDWFDALLPGAMAAGGDDPALKATLAIARGIRERDPELRPRIARGLQRAIAESGAVPLHLLATASALGMVEESFAAIEQSSYAFMFQEDGMDPASVYNPGIIFDRHFCAAIMADPRFVGLCAKLGLCDYWVATEAWPDCAELLAPRYDFKAEARRHAAAPPRLSAATG